MWREGEDGANEGAGRWRLSALHADIRKMIPMRKILAALALALLAGTYASQAANQADRRDQLLDPPQEGAHPAGDAERSVVLGHLAARLR